MGSTLTNLLYHVIFSTKGRESLIVPEIRDEFYRYKWNMMNDTFGHECVVHRPFRT